LLIQFIRSKINQNGITDPAVASSLKAVVDELIKMTGS
jgi:hypothetical protein